MLLFVATHALKMTGRLQHAANKRVRCAFKLLSGVYFYWKNDRYLGRYLAKNIKKRPVEVPLAVFTIS